MKKYLVMSVLVLAGCATTENDGRYTLADDTAPDVVPTLQHIEDAQPRYEPYSRAGNKDYTVLGEQYHVLQEPETYSETGIASWYGKKFHGHKTSNGEIYDIYSMSAAHKTLPLPSYVEVENTANGKKAIVRVNDRGPFHEGRIIDLSYAAASKLDVLKTGTAPVKVTLLKVDKPADDTEWQGARLNRYFVQLVAISDKDKALRAAETFGKQLDQPTDILHADSVYRVRLGPFYDYDKTQNAAMRAREHQINEAFVVVEPITNEPTPNLNVSN
ncbi:septal ring lytic transglycosylase RlpA family protein [Enterovibrio nigricans]|uniref:Endolytic peptidoglycan transglycosylase RlpA n=1 Tax=Enterovibrio nigricans DSM 22720 TaxID=1121868 RepID=A0A1T4U3G4_9GAMM|nr:septal ring lytic transglycosylase RlpA family protein [Enterovibrio nigricans]PKF51829.1 septal ring lytic transglycosylase RlpA family protein [Enterovibrio nigricans]SKA47227.1 rare lipoprotein A [Enterovibrio nigricans DSM 22720]